MTGPYDADEPFTDPQPLVYPQGEDVSGRAQRAARAAVLVVTLLGFVLTAAWIAVLLWSALS